jgi:hypothetical protein
VGATNAIRLPSGLITTESRDAAPLTETEPATVGGMYTSVSWSRTPRFTGTREMALMVKELEGGWKEKERSCPAVARGYTRET